MFLEEGGFSYTSAGTGFRPILVKSIGRWKKKKKG